MPLRTPSDVRGAFRGVGISFDTIRVGNGRDAIIALTTSRFARLNYAISALVLRSEVAAVKIYRSEGPRWRYGGASARRIANVVIVVWPNGTMNGVKGTQAPLPLTVRRALQKLESGTSV
jgi:hypothetical protein